MSKIPPGHWHQPVNKLNDSRCIDVDDNGVRTPAQNSCPNFHQEMETENQSLRALPRDRVWKTPVADGFAYYYIRSEKPLVVLHIPYSDRWQAHPALLRGITLKEMRAQITTETRMEQLFQGVIT